VEHQIEHVFRPNDHSPRRALHHLENSSGLTDQLPVKLGGPCQNEVVSDQWTTAYVAAWANHENVHQRPCNSWQQCPRSVNFIQQQF
jgi:hypothetical protein